MTDDLISKKAAIEAIQDFKQGAAEWRDEQEERSDIWHRADSAVASALEIGLRIKKLPAAQERKGKWRTAYLDHEAMGERPKVLYCSECNQCIAYPTRYCPNCGAKMEADA